MKVINKYNTKTEKSTPPTVGTTFFILSKAGRSKGSASRNGGQQETAIVEAVIHVESREESIIVETKKDIPLSKVLEFSNYETVSRTNQHEKQCV
jgi:hypothetical protein